ncbi:SPASM domain-containing protein [Candidatus Woesearchaeota archaeon]|nr:SPASM domain-containing protein [Candidatus Woesearchaeota archaeon]
MDTCFNYAGKVGNLNEEPLERIWRSEKRMIAARRVCSQEFEFCSRCLSHHENNSFAALYRNLRESRLTKSYRGYDEVEKRVRERRAG